MESIVIEITGHPIAKGRGRVGRLANGRPAVFTPTKTRKWEADARIMARQALSGRAPLSGPVRCSIRAFFTPPASWPAWKREAAIDGLVAHTSKPDSDNLTKAAKDAMNGIVWLDDAQVVQTWTSKLYGETPRVLIEVEPMEAAACQITRREQMKGAE